MKIISIIPARGGSKAIPFKNIVEVGDQPLISYSILDSLRTPSIKETYVTTDDAAIKSIALQYGAEVVDRPKEFATDTSTDMQWAWHFLLWYEERFKQLPDFLVHLRPTSPFRNIELIESAIQKMTQFPDATSLRSVEEFAETPFKWFMLNEGYLDPLMGCELEATNLPRQVLPTVYRPNGYVDILIPKVILGGSLHGGRILGYLTPRTLEIDSEYDLELARAFVEISP